MTSKKNEHFLAYYYKHLKDFGFQWESKNLKFK